MKRIGVLLLILAFTLGGCTEGNSGSNTLNGSVSSQNPEDAPAPFSAIPELDFGETTGVVNGPVAIQNDLVCGWSSIESYLADTDFTEQKVAGMEGIDGLVGYRIYETPGIIFAVRIENSVNDMDTEAYGSVFAVLNGTEFKLKNGIHCGMDFSEAERIIRSYNAQYHVLNIEGIDLGDFEVTSDTAPLTLLRVDQFPRGLFDGCTLAIAVPYTQSADSIGQTLCLYSRTGDTIDFITSNLYGAG